MELKAGYKNTEIGVIPEEWEVKKQKEIVRYINGRAYSLHEWEKKGIPVVRLQNLTNKGGNFYYSNLNLPDYQYMNKGDLIFMWSASFGPYIWWGNKAIFHYHIWKLECKKGKANKDFYYFKLLEITEELKKGTSGSTMLHLTKGFMEEYLISVPPLPEQTAIATVLSDTDNLLQALEKKIAKKQLIKQGAMQVLLKPKEGWVVKTLGKFVNFSNGKAHENHIDVNGKYTVVNSKFVSTGGKVYKKSTVNFSPLKKGDIVMVMSDIPNGKALAKCFLIPKDNKYALNQRICSIRTEEVDTKFLLYILNRNKYYLAFDSGTGQTNLKKEDVLNCPIPLPPTKEEQTEIATILSDMNIEIENLEKQLAKYKQVKQGLMQVLLTGKIRLV